MLGCLECLFAGVGTYEQELKTQRFNEAMLEAVTSLLTSLRSWGLIDSDQLSLSKRLSVELLVEVVKQDFETRSGLGVF